MPAPLPPDAEHPAPAEGQDHSPKKKPWVPPAVTELPKLTDLTLVTGSPIPGIGNPGGGGSTVF